MSIEIVHQGSGNYAYRVEIKDRYGSGYGFGKTPRTAYAAAREEYQESRESETRLSLKDAETEFVKHQSWPPEVGDRVRLIADCPDKGMMATVESIVEYEDETLYFINAWYEDHEGGHLGAFPVTDLQHPLYPNPSTIEEWRALMTCTDDDTGALGWVDEENAQGLLSGDELLMYLAYIKQHPQVDPPSEAKSLPLDKYIEGREEIAANGTRYATWYKTYKSTFGDFTWGVTDWATGNGGGGSTKTEDEAKAAIAEYIRDQDPDHHAAKLERETEARLDAEQAEREEQEFFDAHDETHLDADE